VLEVKLGSCWLWKGSFHKLSICFRHFLLSIQQTKKGVDIYTTGQACEITWGDYQKGLLKKATWEDYLKRPAH
jgi:hypothetical protein